MKSLSPHARTTPAVRRPRLTCRPLILVAALVAALLSTLLSTMVPAVAGVRGGTPTKPSGSGDRSGTTMVAVDPRMFGVHDYHLSSLSRPDTGAIRLWDSDTQWNDLQADPGAIDFTRLDHIVQLAHANGTEVTLVVAMTPQWAATDPSSPTYDSEMPRIAAYRQFVSAVMSRYRDYFGPGIDGIANYQVWNEANIDTFWTGTPAQMARLTRAMWQVRNAVDPDARVIAPAFESRYPYQRAWIRKFYHQRVGGVAVWKFVDALSINLYPKDTYHGRAGTPEDSLRLLATCRRILAREGVPSSLPVWNTEVNYGLLSGGPGQRPAVPISESLQIAYVMRTYLLNAANRVGRVFWYAYDMGNLDPAQGGRPLGNTLMTTPSDRTTLTPAGDAFSRVQSWMGVELVGTDGRQPCSKDTHGTYTCQVRYADGGTGWIYWNPYATGRVTLARAAHTAYDEYGNASAVTGGQTMRVGYAPVLVR